MRTRLSVNVYLSNLHIMLRNWSKDTLKEKLLVNNVSFSEKNWKLAASYLNSGNGYLLLSYHFHLVHYSIVDTFIYAQEHFIHMQKSLFVSEISLSLVKNLYF